jgi:ATP-binding protein involved in chromosome partitioning
MRSKVIQQFLGDVAWGDLDVLVADLPPGTGDEIITIAQNMTPTLALIVTTPQDVALLDSRRAINLARCMEIPKIALIENMSGLSCPECGHRLDLFGSGGGKKQAMDEGILYLGSLPIDPEARELADRGRPVVLERDGSPVSMAINAIAQKVDTMLTRPDSLPVLA